MAQAAAGIHSANRSRGRHTHAGAAGGMHGDLHGLALGVSDGFTGLKAARQCADGGLQWRAGIVLGGGGTLGGTLGIHMCAEGTGPGSFLVGESVGFVSSHAERGLVGDHIVNEVFLELIEFVIGARDVVSSHTIAAVEGFGFGGLGRLFNFNSLV